MVTFNVLRYTPSYGDTIGATLSNSPGSLEIKFSYPNGYLKFKGGAPFAQYKGATCGSIRFEF